MLPVAGAIREIDCDVKHRSAIRVVGERVADRIDLILAGAFAPVAEVHDPANLVDEDQTYR